MRCIGMQYFAYSVNFTCLFCNILHIAARHQNMNLAQFLRRINRMERITVQLFAIMFRKN